MPLTLLAIVAVAFMFYRDQLLELMIAAENGLRESQTSSPVMTALIGLVIYILVAGLTPVQHFCPSHMVGFLAFGKGRCLSVSDQLRARP